MSKLPDVTNEILEPISLDELYDAVKAGKPHKSPGCDGITQEFFKSKWEIIKEDLLQIVNKMYGESQLPEQQTFRIIVCLPKRQNAQTLVDYRPLTILNTDFKLLTRSIGNCLKPWVPSLLSNSQHCGITGSSIFDALATIRDIVAYAEETRTPMCVLTLDFQGAFDNISYEYLYEIIYRYGFSKNSDHAFRISTITQRPQFK
jgi:hypothetical protein